MPNCTKLSFLIRHGVLVFTACHMNSVSSITMAAMDIYWLTIQVNDMALSVSVCNLPY